MKIIYMHQYFKTPDMTGGTRSYEFARRLVSWGHEVHVITSWTDETENTGWFSSEVDGICVHWLPIRYQNQMGFWKRLKAFSTFALRADRKAREIGGDVVFCTSTPLTIAIPGVRASRSLKVPMVFEVRDLWPEMPIAMGALKHPALQYAAKQLEKFAYKNASHIVALSPGMRDGVLKVDPKAKVTVIPNSCDLELFDSSDTLPDDFFKEHGFLRGKRIVTYTGTLGAVNGVDYLARIAAASAARGFEICYVAIGDGAKSSSIEQEARRLGVWKKNFYILPPKPKRDIPAVMKATSLALSLFVDIPEMSVNSANKFFDALASGNAIAINYEGWQADIIRDEHIGLVIPADDAKAAAQQINSMLQDDARLTDCATRARMTGKRLFDRTKLARQLEDVLSGVVASDLSTNGGRPGA